MSAPRPGTRPGSWPPRTLEPKLLPLGSSSHCGPGQDLPSSRPAGGPPTAGRCGQRPQALQRPGSVWNQQGRPPIPQEAGSLRNYPQQSQEAPSFTSLGSKAHSWEAASRVVWALTLPSCNSPGWRPARGSPYVPVSWSQPLHHPALSQYPRPPHLPLISPFVGGTPQY